MGAGSVVGARVLVRSGLAPDLRWRQRAGPVSPESPHFK
jgi:hypothetical protein